MARFDYLSVPALLAVGLLAVQIGCGPPDPDGGVCFSSCCSVRTASDESINCYEIEVCTASVEQRVACCECDPGLFCAPEVPCDIGDDPLPDQEASTCMTCHNGSEREDYIGTGMQNPHPFAGARFISCVTCHGGDPTATSPEDAHIPRPIEILDNLQLANDAVSYQHYLTHTGVEDMGNYQVGAQTFEPIDWLQFVNPGAVAVVERGRGCATSGCHTELGEWMATSVMTTAAGMASAIADASGAANAFPERVDWYSDTAADYGFRAAVDPAFALTDDPFGPVGSILRLPEKAAYQVGDIFNNPLYESGGLADDVVAASDGTVHQGQLLTGSPLHDLLVVGTSQACGHCHLSGRGRNRSAGDFRSSGCSACHMDYDLVGRSQSRDPNVQIDEPINPDAIRAPENAHPTAHLIVSAAEVLPSGEVVRGVDDRTCGTCHRQSHDTMLEFSGIRVDQHEDVVNQRQHPADPVNFQNSANEQRLFDPGQQNQTYQGMNVNQLLPFEDYDADGRDDTPADIHHERGLSCIDCHGGSDAHNGAPGDALSGALFSRARQAVAIACESCHGDIEQYAATTPCRNTLDEDSQCVVDRRGNALEHVFRDESGDYWLRSRQVGRLHYIAQTRDVVVDSGRLHPVTGLAVYNARASYAMGRADGDPDTGIGPQQGDGSLVTAGFSHSDRMDCVSCHASWNNQRFGEFLELYYDANPQNFFISPIDGQRTALFAPDRQFIYASPIPFFLGVGSRGLVTQTGPEIQLLFQQEQDLNGNSSRVFAFTDRRGNGNNPGYDGRGPFAALGHGPVMAHTIRGRPNESFEGARQCVACHLNSEQMNEFGVAYGAFIDSMNNAQVGDLDFNMLQTHIGRNTGNELNSPIFVHMAAGLGTGLWYFDADGCPVNPGDDNRDHVTCNGSAPADIFDPARVVFALDQPGSWTGVANASNHQPAASAARTNDIAALRDGAHNPAMPGPLGASLSQKLADPNAGLILDSWIDANGNPRGQAGDFL